MKIPTISVKHLGSELRDKLIGSIRTVVELLKDGVWAVIRWHQERMITDPKYPRTLLTIGKALVAFFIPSALVAGALVALLSDLLGAYPHHYDQPDDYTDWSDSDWN
jgi:hypothetical protein